ncbi:hypothetical protein EYF80_035818 [Liparis tanakae]|uniref:Uncharacterized protein n=1 Tax=Liparis tanakae TaxID=230148 RepID=A0A4Z2GMH9_9TELE|nr:hypothetical protein EYF80_035818 [Liparis tanakae]
MEDAYLLNLAELPLLASSGPIYRYEARQAGSRCAEPALHVAHSKMRMAWRRELRQCHYRNVIQKEGREGGEGLRQRRKREGVIKRGREGRMRRSMLWLWSCCVDSRYLSFIKASQDNSSSSSI